MFDLRREREGERERLDDERDSGKKEKEFACRVCGSSSGIEMLIVTREWGEAAGDGGGCCKGGEREKQTARGREGEDADTRERKRGEEDLSIFFMMSG